MTILIFLMAAHFHPVHISVSNVYFKPKEKVVQVEQRIFLDDFEEALKDYTQNIYLNITDDDPAKTKALFKKYLSERFWIEANGSKIELEYLGHEFDQKQNIVWFYYEAEKVRKFESFSVKNSILLEKFDDQENLIHYKGPDGEKKSNLTSSKRSMVDF